MNAPLQATMNIRRTTAADAPSVLKLFDEAINWFVSFGNEDQWGTVPWSTQKRQISRVTETCALPDSWAAELPELGLCGFLALGDPGPEIPTPDQPEIYVRVLIASRDVRARGIGRRLLEFAEERARTEGVGQLRVDCYRGGTGALVAFYESCGYQRTAEFDVDGWPGQLLTRTLGPFPG